MSDYENVWAGATVWECSAMADIWLFEVPSSSHRLKISWVLHSALISLVINCELSDPKLMLHFVYSLLIYYFAFIFWHFEDIFMCANVDGATPPLYIPLISVYLCGRQNKGPCIVCCAKSLQSCPTLFDPMDCSLPGSTIHGILPARMLEWLVFSSSRGSSQPRNWTLVSYISCIGRRVLYNSAFPTTSATW